MRLYVLRFWLLFFGFLIGHVSSSGQEGSSSSETELSEIRNLMKHRAFEDALTRLDGLESDADDVLTRATILHLRGSCLNKLGRYQESVDVLRAGLDLEGTDDTIQASLHYLQGINLYRLSQYAEATTYVETAVELNQKIHGPDSRIVGAHLNTLGFLYNIQARYREAERTFQRARKGNLRRTGGEDIQYARIINNLADVYCRLNKFDQAYELYQTSLRIKESLSGRQSRDYANTLYNLADFHASLGRYGQARELIEDGIHIFQEIGMTDHQDYLKFLDYQAILYEKLGEVQEAEKQFLHTLQIRKDRKATATDDYALNLQNLGNLYLEMERWKEAEQIAEKSVPLTATIYGDLHPNYAGALQLLASAQAALGQEKEADQHFQKAIRIVQKTLGKKHIEHFHVQFAYARFLQSTGQLQEAREIYRSIDQIPRGYLRRASRFLSERELEEKVEEYRDYGRQVYSLMRSMPEDPEVSALAMNSLLYYRGFIMQTLQKWRRGMQMARMVSDSQDELVSLHRQLENQLNQPVESRGSTSKLEKRISDLESEIARSLGGLSLEDDDVQWEDIQLSLGFGEAVVEYLAFPDPHHGDTVFYGAVLLDEAAEAPRYVELCTEYDLRLLFSNRDVRTSEYVERIYGYRSRGLVPEGPEVKPLVDLIWRPLQDAGLDADRAYLIPDGIVNRVAVGALPVSLDSVVADEMDLVYLPSSRSVMVRDEQIMAYQTQSSLLIGGIAYDDPQATPLASRSGGREGTRRTWQYLDFAEREVHNISATMQDSEFETVLLGGMEAEERTVTETLTRGEGWRVVHFATHGYFDAATEDQQADNFYGRGMTNSGLVLAGANDLFAGAQQSASDGLLSAYEVSRMDLQHTELVVLSACETGLGDLSDEEGVYGLQRAFRLAGAEKLIMSLWQVPDRETRDFMTTFYRHWLEEGLPIREAFQTTQQIFRERFINPYQWAGFILLE